MSIYKIDAVHSLSTLPANDGNFKSELERATNEQIEKAIQTMNESGGMNKSRINACKRELRKRNKVAKC